MVNACSRLGDSGVALQFGMEIPSARKEAEAIHTKHITNIIPALDFPEKSETK